MKRRRERIIEGRRRLRGASDAGNKFLDFVDVLWWPTPGDGGGSHGTGGG